MKYQRLAKVYEQLASTSKRLEKTKIISEFLKSVDDNELNIVILLIQGKIFPPWDETKTGISDKLLVKAISRVSGESQDKVIHILKNTGDLGDTVKELKIKGQQTSLFQTPLTLRKVFDNFRNIAKFSGSGTVDRKLQLINELLIPAHPIEAKYIVRTLLDDLRIGVGKGSIRDATVWAYSSKFNLELIDNKLLFDDIERKEYNKVVAKVQGAYDITNDFSKVIRIIRKKGFSGLKELKLEPTKPINVMLYPKAKSISDAFETVGKPAAFEYKYDGFRMQIHKNAENVIIFTRRLENVTEQFPEVKDIILSNVKAKTCIFDCEAVGFDSTTGKYQPFQSISQRIKRKHNILEMATKFPVELNVFDVLEYNGENLIKTEFKERRELLEKIVKPENKKIVLAKQIVTDNEQEVTEFYDQALAEGQEGIMAKNLSGIYKPGARVGYGVKIKPTMEPLDLVIVGAEWGEGKRKGWLTSFNLACLDETGEDFLEIGKVSTGLKELETQGFSFKELTEILQPLIKHQDSKIVQISPKVVIEVKYEEIQKSTNYSSGFALRFPRFSRIRQEKPVSEINSINDIKKTFDEQFS